MKLTNNIVKVATRTIYNTVWEDWIITEVILECDEDAKHYYCKSKFICTIADLDNKTDIISEEVKNNTNIMQIVAKFKDYFSINSVHITDKGYPVEVCEATDVKKYFSNLCKADYKVSD